MNSGKFRILSSPSPTGFIEINERIEVAGVYAQGRFFPKKFKWKNQIFKIDQVTLVSELKDGLTKKRLYSVQSGPNVYRLIFDREGETWSLSEVWYE